VAYYDHRHSGTDETNILQEVKAVEGETSLVIEMITAFHMDGPNSVPGLGLLLSTLPQSLAEVQICSYRTAFLADMLENFIIGLMHIITLGKYLDSTSILLPQ
jgi:hypothetical protein